MPPTNTIFDFITDGAKLCQYGSRECCPIRQPGKITVFMLNLAVQLHSIAAFGSLTESRMLIDHPLLQGVLGSGYSTMCVAVLIGMSSMLDS